MIYNIGMIKSFFKLFVLFSIFTPVLSFAETTSIPSQIPELQEQISVNVDKDFPKPYETININLEAFGTDLNKATITWTVNGAVVKKGIGEVNFGVVAGAIGTSKKVSVIIQPVGGLPITQSLTIAPGETDLIWEARTYTPPFYKGKAMYTPQENVVVVSMPNFITSSGVQMDRSKLVYTWSKNGDVEQDQSGYGKNVFKLQGGILMKEDTISAEVTGFGKERAKESIDLLLLQPEALFYENNPQYGILFNKSLSGTYAFDEAEKNIEAFPYYFGAFRKSDPSLTYEWSLNNEKIFVPATKSNVVFRNTSEESGTSVINLIVGNTSNFLEEARNSVYLKFETPKSSVSF